MLTIPAAAQQGAHVPVSSHRSRSSLFVLELEGNHGVRTNVARPRPDLLKGKLIKILL